MENDLGYYEVDLPQFLQDDIEALKEGIKNHSSVLDCLYDEVYGSINSALYSAQINDEQAKYLRRKYLGI